MQSSLRLGCVISTFQSLTPFVVALGYLNLFFFFNHKSKKFLPPFFFSGWTSCLWCCNFITISSDIRACFVVKKKETPAIMSHGGSLEKRVWYSCWDIWPALDRLSDVCTAMQATISLMMIRSMMSERKSNYEADEVDEKSGGWVKGSGALA